MHLLVGGWTHNACYVCLSPFAFSRVFALAQPSFQLSPPDFLCERSCCWRGRQRLPQFQGRARHPVCLAFEYTILVFVGGESLASFPTEEEAQGFVTIEAIADWVGLNVLVIPAIERQTMLPPVVTREAVKVAKITETDGQEDSLPRWKLRTLGWFGALLVAS